MVVTVIDSDGRKSVAKDRVVAGAADVEAVVAFGDVVAVEAVVAVGVGIAVAAVVAGVAGAD